MPLIKTAMALRFPGQPPAKTTSFTMPLSTVKSIWVAQTPVVIYVFILIHSLSNALSMHFDQGGDIPAQLVFAPKLSLTKAVIGV